MSGPIDVFIIAGQSNAVGQGDKTQSPPVNPDKVLQIYNSKISAANDPVGNATNGSAWPAFGNTYLEFSGRSIAFVPTAIGGSGLSAYSDIGTGHWSAHTFFGQIDLLGDSIAATQHALGLLAENGYSPTLKGVLWSQGENEANNINHGSTLTQNGYAQMLANVITRFRKNLGDDLPFYIFKTGTDTRQNNDTGYAIIRTAQDDVAANVPHTKIVFEDAVTFATRSMLSDGIHYTQAGYNEMGQEASKNIIKSA